MISLFLSAAPLLQSVRVNGDLARDGQPVAGSVATQRFSPDESWVVFSTFGPPRLYSAPADGSGPSRSLLGGLQPDATSNIDFESSNTHVVFRLFTSTGSRLHAVPLDGSTPPRALTTSGVGAFRLIPDGTIVVFTDGTGVHRVSVDRVEPPTDLAAFTNLQQSLQLSPDGAWAVFVVGFYDLYAVPLDGSAPALRINTFGGDVDSFRIAPDSTRVVYQTKDAAKNLYSVPIGGGSAVPLNPALPPGRNLSTSYAIDPTGARVVYVADQLTNDVDELFSVPLDGSAAPLRLNAPLPTDWDVTGDFQITAGGARVVFVQANRRVSAFVAELRSVPIDGSAAPLRLDDPPPGPPPNLAIPFAFDPTGARAVYSSDQVTHGVRELFSVPVDRSAPPVRLNGTLVAGGSVTGPLDVFRVGTSSVVYLAEQATVGVRELWTRRLDGSGSSARLSGPLGPAADVGLSNLRLSSDGKRALFTADATIDERFAPWSARVDLSTPAVDLSAGGPPPVVGDVSRYAWSSDGRAILYEADEVADERQELFRVTRIRGSRSVLNAPLAAGERVNGFVLDPESARVVYAKTKPVDLFQAPFRALFAATQDGRTAAVQLDVPSAREYTSRESVPSGGRLAFVRSSGGGTHPDTGDTLYAAPLDGSAAPVALHDALDHAIGTVRPTPDGTRVVFTDVVPGSSAPRLFSAPTDASAPPLEIDRGTNPAVGNFAFRVHPDGNTVVYVADDEVDEVFELWRTTADGSAAPARVLPALAANRDVDPEFLLAPDGAHVVFRADLGHDEVFNLYSAPTAGGPSVRLSGPMNAGGDVAPVFAGPHFALSDDGARVLYVADQTLDEVFELFSAPLDGSAPPIELSAPLGGGRDVQVQGARFAPGGARVVYVADQDTDDVFELYGVPAAGGASVKLSGPMVAGGDVLLDSHGARDAFAFSPDGALVFYLADQDVDGRVELYSAPVDGSAAPARRNGTLLPDGDVKSFLPGPGRAVLYLADELTDEVFELFLAEAGPRGVFPPTGAPLVPIVR